MRNLAVISCLFAVLLILTQPFDAHGHASYGHSDDVTTPEADPDSCPGPNVLDDFDATDASTNWPSCTTETCVANYNPTLGRGWVRAAVSAVCRGDGAEDTSTSHNALVYRR